MWVVGVSTKHGKKPSNQSKVVATQILFIFTPNLGEMIQFDEHIFQTGWFNHQLGSELLGD